MANASRCRRLHPGAAGARTLADLYLARDFELNILVNNAGAAWGAEIETFPESGWDKVMDLNVKAPFFLVQVRTFVVLTTPSNDLVSRIHDRMPAILKPAGYERWLGLEPDPRDLLVPFPSEPLTIWPISRRINSPDNDDEGLLEEIFPPADIAV